MNRLSVIIPTHDKPERLVLTLHALLAQDMPKHHFEVVVVLDGCLAETEAVLHAVEILGLPLRTVATARIGQAAARNAGVRQAAGSLLVFVDDDVLLCPTYLSTMAALLVRHPGTVLRAPVFLLRNLAVFRDPERGIPYDGRSKRRMSSRLMDERISRDRIRDEWHWIAGRCRHLNCFERLVQDQMTATPQRTPWIGYSGSGVAIARGLFEAAEGYDEAFGLRWGCEAIELGYRLWRKGVRFRHVDTIYSAHMDHPRAASLASFDDSFDRFFRRHGDPDIRFVQRLIGAGFGSAAT